MKRGTLMRTALILLLAPVTAALAVATAESRVVEVDAAPRAQPQVQLAHPPVLPFCDQLCSSQGAAR
ncbi:hypothetical protein [Motiliproteus sp. SC1-56]|uniref:hypothetical protein n=1 Tax=Motiliproteus sp. SC1-56 TaxID=2799565 RepID=UPI001A8DB12C|nr:hypothetical protein [Motiliproteus sp. SC1-56]